MKLLLIEDDRIIADFVIKGLKEAGYAIEHASDGETGLARVISGNFDLAIIDIMLPRLDGLTVISKIRERKINLPIIILSARRSVDERISGLQSGSDDYLTKPFSFSELLARVEALLRRASQVVEASTLSIKDLEIDLLARSVTRSGKKIDLQPREFALLEYLIRNKGRVVSKTMIMERVWDYNFDPGTNVVEARISKLRDKIDKGSSDPLIHTIRGLGYVIK